MRGYAAMHATKPDFFIHSGDTIYADGPIAAQVTEPDGQIWRNLVTEEVSKVAETLNEYRGRHRYNLMDRNIRALYAEVPVIAQWDDHETTNNWYPGEILTDPRYTERRVDVLAARGRQAWQEYQPVSGLSTRAGDGSTGFEPARIYRKISRGPQLEVFCLDMRTFKDPNTDGKETHLTHILGEEQTRWLINEVSKSKATWKVISADLPLGLIVPDGAVNQESLANRDAGAPLGKELEIAGVLSAFKRNRVKNVVWLTADVHYCAAHHYSPERAGFTDFDPFWEFVAGPINAGSFGPGELDGTFGPEVVVLQVRRLRQPVPAQRREPVLRPRGPGRGRRLHRQPPQRQRQRPLEQGPPPGALTGCLGSTTRGSATAGGRQTLPASRRRGSFSCGSGRLVAKLRSARDVHGARLRVAEPCGVQDLKRVDGFNARDRLGSLAGNGQRELLVVGVIRALFGRHACLAGRRREGSPAGLFLITPRGRIVRGSRACNGGIGLHVRLL